MARIQEYRQQSRTPGAVDYQKASGRSGFGEALGIIGETVNKVQDDYDKYQKREGEYYAASSAAQYALEDDEFIAQETKNYDPAKYKDKATNPEGKEFHSELSEKLYERRQERLENAPNEYARRALEMRLTQIDGHNIEQTRKFQANADADYGVKTYKTNLTNSANHARSNPQNLQNIIKLNDDQIQSMPFIGEAEKRSLKIESNTALHDSAIDGKVSTLELKNNASVKDVEVLIQEMKSDKSPWMGSNSKEMYDNALTRLEKRKVELREKSKTDAVINFKNYENYVRNEGILPKEYTEESIINSGNSPAKIKQLLVERSYAIEEGKAKKLIEALPLNEAEKYINSKEINDPLKNDPANYDLATRRKEALVSAFNKRQKESEEDLAGYTARVSESVNKSKRNVEEAFMNDVLVKNPSTIKLAKDYADNAMAEQRRLNPNAAPSLLDKTMVSSVSAQIKNITYDENGVDQALLTLQNQYKLWGDNAPIAFKDLKNGKAINSSHYVAASLVDSPEKTWLAKDLLRANIIPSKDLTAAADTSESEVRKDVATSLMDFKKTLGSSIDGDTIYRDYEDSLTQLGLYYKSQGRDVDMADLANEVVLDEFQFVDKSSANFRVPKNIDSSEVYKGATKTLAKIKSMDLVTPPSMNGIEGADAKEIYQDRILSGGRWVNNGNDGLKLVDERGSNVLRKVEGRIVPVALTWDELQLQNKNKVNPNNEFKLGGLGVN